MSLGLTQSEVDERIRQGKVNSVDNKTSRSVTEILRTNLLSIANVILIAIVIVLAAVGSYGDAFATGAIVLINVVIGTFQEFRAKRQLDKIALLNRPTVTVIRDNQEQEIDQDQVVVDDVMVLKSGDQAVVDGRFLPDPRKDTGRQSVDMDESLLTGESDNIRKYEGDEILSGSFCVVGEGLFVAEKVGDDSFAQKITSGAREYTRMITPLQSEISIIVRVLVILAISLSILLGLAYAVQELPFEEGVEDAAVVISLIPQGLLLMISVAYAIGAVRIAGKGALVQQSNAVESISHVNVLCLDKTGTLTTNNILFHTFHPLNGYEEDEIRSALGNYIASTGANNQTAQAVANSISGKEMKLVSQIPFSSARKWAAASMQTEDISGTYVFGAPSMLVDALSQQHDFSAMQDELTKQGLRVLLFAYSPHVIQPEDIPEDRDADLPPDLKAMALVSFSDELRPDVNKVLDNFRRAGITLKLISGDNATTVAALARKAGFSDDDKEISGNELAKMSPSQFTETVRETTIFGRITPEQKQTIVNILRNDGHYVAMMGDGVNDVLSLKQAQVGISMEDGSQATRSVADIVLLGNKFSALPEAFLEGQRVINGMHDVTRLFLTRTLYTAILILIAGFIGTVFPLTPRHNVLLTTLPVGIPAFFLQTWAKTGTPKNSLLSSVTRFVLPVGFSMTVVAAFLWVLYQTDSLSSTETARTVLTVAGLLGGFWVIILAEHQREDWYDGSPVRDTDQRRIILTIILAIITLLIFPIAAIREWFELTTLSPVDIVTIGASMTVWALALGAILRYDILERIMNPNYDPNHAEEE